MRCGSTWRGFEAAILNLVVNARDAMPDGGLIRIVADNAVQPRAAADLGAGDYVRVEIRDGGVGMDRHVLERAAQPFFTTKHEAGGTGLGLSQVKSFASAAGGAMRIESVKGAGTVVHLYLPKAASAQGEAAVRQAPPLRQARAGETVLVVDDDPLVRGVAVEALKDLGYQGLEAASGDQALGVLHGEQAVDFLFSDVVTPGGMNGVESRGEGPPDSGRASRCC